MTLRTAFTIWIIISVLMLLEYYALNYGPQFSVLTLIQNKLHVWKDVKLVTKAGRTISYILGWAGFAIMLLTNLYIIRKRAHFMSKWGNIQNWMGFHIMCGLVGPTAIIFHSDFRVHGLVAISFWSMMVVAISGIMGSYFYLQILSQKKQLQESIGHWDRIIKKMRDKKAKHIEDDALEHLKLNAVRFAGGSAAIEDVGIIDLPLIFAKSIIGDFRLFFSDPKSHPHLPKKSRIALANYGVSVRKATLLQPFTLMLGYWHAFHVPFTITMYITAIIHIAVTLMFRV